MNSWPKFYELLTEEPLKNSHIKYKLGTIKLLEENTSRTPLIKTIAIYFSDLSPRAKEMKAKISKWDLIKLTRFLTAKETIYQHEMKTI